jgi:hypothetical protein
LSTYLPGTLNASGLFTAPPSTMIRVNVVKLVPQQWYAQCSPRQCKRCQRDKTARTKTTQVLRNARRFLQRAPRPAGVSASACLQPHAYIMRARASSSFAAWSRRATQDGQVGSQLSLCPRRSCFPVAQRRAAATRRLRESTLGGRRCAATFALLTQPPPPTSLPPQRQQQPPARAARAAAAQQQQHWAAAAAEAAAAAAAATAAAAAAAAQQQQ